MFILGLVAAIIGNAIIGAGQCVQKYALNRLHQNKSSDSLLQQQQQPSRLQSPLWILGIVLCYAGEFGNMLGITFASASLVTPLGIISVFSNAILASIMLGERIDGEEQKQGYMFIVLGVFLILSVAPKGGGGSDAVGIDAVQSVVEWAAYIRQSWIFSSVGVLFAVAGVALLTVTKSSRRDILVYLCGGSSFGAVSIICSKAVTQYFRVLASSPSSSPPDSKSPLVMDGSVKYSLVAPLCACIVMAVVCQEIMKQLALSRFPVSKLQPQYYAMYNIIVVLSSSIVFQEIRGGMGEWLYFLSAFFVGIVIIMHGSTKIQNEANDEVFAMIVKAPSVTATSSSAGGKLALI